MTKSLSKRLLAVALAFVCIFTIIPSSTVEAANNTSGWAIVKNNTTVKNSAGNSIGTVYALEGVTVLSISGSKAKIEYSTASGAKQGYISTSSFYYNELSNSCVAKVKTSCSTYYAASTNLKAGSLSAGEYVAVLSSNGVYDYVEYNTTSGRKRAYVAKSNLTYTTSGTILDHIQNRFTAYSMSVGSKTTVYSGPSKQYASIGYLNAGESCVWFTDFPVNSGDDAMLYIRYTASGKNKYGYIYVKDFN